MVEFADLIGRTSGIAHVVEVVDIFVDAAHNRCALNLLAPFVGDMENLFPVGSGEAGRGEDVGAAVVARRTLVLDAHVVEVVVGVEDDVGVDHGVSRVVEEAGLGECAEILVGIGVVDLVVAVARVEAEQRVVDEICTLAVHGIGIPDPLGCPDAAHVGIFGVGLVGVGSGFWIRKDRLAFAEVEGGRFPVNEVGGAEKVEAEVVPHARGGVAHVGGGHEVFARALTAVDVGVAGAVLDSGAVVGVKHLVAAKQLGEGHASVFAGAEGEVGYLFVRLHVAVEISGHAVGGGDGDGKFDLRDLTAGVGHIGHERRACYGRLVGEGCHGQTG